MSLVAAVADPHEGKRKAEANWPIFRIHHQRSRYIYDLFYRRKAISRELYEYCLEQGTADKNLIAKWKKPGYENLCCLRCIQTRDTNHGTNCICRVPKSQLSDVSLAFAEGLRQEDGLWLRLVSHILLLQEHRKGLIECVHCGCRGCGGS